MNLASCQLALVGASCGPPELNSWLSKLEGDAPRQAAWCLCCRPWRLTHWSHVAWHMPLGEADEKGHLHWWGMLWIGARQCNSLTPFVKPG